MVIDNEELEPLLTAKIIGKILADTEQLIERAINYDPIMTRSLQFKQDITKSLQCYENSYKDLMRKAKEKMHRVAARIECAYLRFSRRTQPSTYQATTPPIRPAPFTSAADRQDPEESSVLRGPGDEVVHPCGPGPRVRVSVSIELIYYSTLRAGPRTTTQLACPPSVIVSVRASAQMLVRDDQVYQRTLKAAQRDEITRSVAEWVNALTDEQVSAELQQRSLIVSPEKEINRDRLLRALCYSVDKHCSMQWDTTRDGVLPVFMPATSVTPSKGAIKRPSATDKQTNKSRKSPKDRSRSEDTRTRIFTSRAATPRPRGHESALTGGLSAPLIPSINMWPAPDELTRGAPADSAAAANDILPSIELTPPETRRRDSESRGNAFSRSPKRSDSEMSDGAPTVVQVPPSQPTSSEGSSSESSPSDDSSSDSDASRHRRKGKHHSKEKAASKKSKHGTSKRGEPRRSDEQIMKRLQNWKISFAGGDRAKAEMFITRLAKCRAGTSVDDQRLIDAVQATLSGEADLWYRAARPSFKSWKRFESSFRKMFIGKLGEFKLLQELRNRRQGEEESIVTFIVYFNFYLSHLTEKPSRREQVKIAWNKHPPGISQRALQSNAEIAESNPKSRGAL
ncbi:unnamed protein product [Trichogramma brassicae]|uniref:Retrotransposon gag domain-containing protein n=1 Tax=Trichogramma brassicae TaxID=86971 RepID=A0A6H5J566_9HYME|nr:unnamed protein product [Trichogramma brassicae]